MSHAEFWLVFTLGGCVGLALASGLGAVVLLRQGTQAPADNHRGNPNGAKLTDGHYYRVEAHPEHPWCTVLVVGAWKWEMDERRIEFGLSDAQRLALKVRKVWEEREKEVRDS